MPCRRRPGCSARTVPRLGAARSITRSSITTTRTGMSTRCSRSRASTPPTTASGGQHCRPPVLDRSMAPYDAFLLVSFGGPEGPDDVMPFLENVTAGRSVPRERLAQVAEHYHAFGGVSPLHQQRPDLIGAIEKDFAPRSAALPV